MRRFTSRVPAPQEAQDGGARKGRALSDGIRILNPLRIEAAFVCSTDARLRDAIPSLSKSLPWVDARTINPAGLSGKLSDSHFALIMNDAAAGFLNAERFRQNHGDNAVAVLLTSSAYIGCAPLHESLARHSYVAKAQLVFHFGDEHPASSVMPTAIRCAEDRMNIGAHSQQRRFIFLVVDDEPRWFSEFLPVLYGIIGQRADILTARTYEDAMGCLTAYGDDIVCLISDINIPRGNSMGPHGKDIITFASHEYPRVPIIIASKADEARALSHIGFVLPKGDEGALRELERHVRDFTGLGDFLFYKDGKFLARAANLSELRDRIAHLPIDVLELYGEKDYFSTWLYMHGFHNIADVLRPRADRGDALRRTLLEGMDAELKAVSVHPFLFLDENGIEVARAGSISELARAIRQVDLGIIEFYSHIDGFSTWLMRTGHSALADMLRPLHAAGEDLRSGLAGIIEKYEARSR